MSGPEPKPDQSTAEALLGRIARDIQAMRSDLTKAINATHDAESEIPEKMRRFVMYFHDIHDISNTYHELGLEVPDHVRGELERCDDRMRHLLADLNEPGGVFDKVRRDMTQRPDNRWDHGKLLTKQEPIDETRNG